MKYEEKGRQPKKNSKMEDDPIFWKMEDNLNLFEMVDNLNATLFQPQQDKIF
jgi:hypothetical protein